MRDKWDMDKCPDCQVEPGQRHSEGCDVARCSVHGWQYISCGECYDWDDNILVGNDDAKPTVWTGIWPGVEECREYGFMTSDPIFLAPGETETEDLNMIGGLAAFGMLVWDSSKERWIRP